MYTNTVSVQILISLIKEYGIDHIVISPGTRAMPFVHSVEEDPFFTCYSVTDERSAGFFALGMIQQLKRPVAVCCTSGTAVMNILSATQEALFQRLPLLVLTAERPLRVLDQYPDQMVPTHNLYKNVCKKSVILPIIKNDKDRWRCSLSVNQALAELEHKVHGPVNIIFQIDEHEVFDFGTQKLPVVKKIERLIVEESGALWKKRVIELEKADKILIICGQHKPFVKDEVTVLNEFSRKFNCVLFHDNISNLHIEKGLNPNLTVALSASDSFKKLYPDIVITFGGHSVFKLANCIGPETDHWLINEDGDFIDHIKKLTCVFESSDRYFFKYFIDNASDEIQKVGNNTYFEEWKGIIGKNRMNNLAYSDISAVQKLMQKVPEESLLHIGNSLSIRYSQFFEIPASIEVCCNRGSNGIDGSLSTFIGASSVSDRLSFLIIGDLSFFYDMTGLWNRYQGKNIRILLNNNSGGMLFNSHIYWAPYNGVNKHIAAEHNATARGWCESRGYKYLSATNDEELENNLKEFVTNNSDSPVILEVLTEKTSNDEILLQYIKKNKDITAERVVQFIQRRIKK